MTVYYPDVSNHNAGIGLANALFVIAKITEGASFVDPDYAGFVAQANQHGIPHAAYHFLHAGDPQGQAEFCHAHAGKTPLMLDFEPASGSTPSLSDGYAFIDRYRAIGGICYLDYFPRWYWSQLGQPSLKGLTDRGMHLVSSAYTAYKDDASGLGWQPYGGITPTVWQYTSTLTFGGKTGSVDFNAYRGSYAGKEDPASVHAAVAELRSIVTTGRLPQPAPGPGYGAPTGLHITAGHTNFEASWQPPAGQHPPEYIVYVWHGPADHAHLVPKYPRYVLNGATHATEGGLDPHTEYLIRVVSSGPGGALVKPGVFAAETFTTGG